MARISSKERVIACIDMGRFYASCAAVELGQDPMKAYIAVVGNQERKGSVVLEVSTRMKKEFGIKTGTRLFEIPDDPRIQLVEPKMGLYLKISMAITDLILQYVPQEDIHVYSVDESFIDFTGVLHFWRSAETLALEIQDALIRQFSLSSTVGITPLSKMWGTGSRMEANLNNMGIFSVGDEEI